MPSRKRTVLIDTPPVFKRKAGDSSDAPPAKKPRTDFVHPYGWVMSAYGQSIPPKKISKKLLTRCKTVFKKTSYWIDHGTEARCSLEKYALDIFDLHFKRTGLKVVPPNSGAEWWVQIRSNDGPDGESLGFHWDRDEDIAATSMGKKIVCPAFATVTYLSDTGAPTVIAPLAPIAAKGKRAVPQIHVSHPSPGKHIVFRGDQLHGCPPEMMRKSTKKTSYSRVTLLVNVWIGHKPSAMKPLEEAVLAQLGETTESHEELFSLGAEEHPEWVEAGASAQVMGFAFGRKGVEDHQLWVPIPPKKAAAFGTFTLKCPSTSKLVKA